MPPSSAKRWTAATNASVIGCITAPEANGSPRWCLKNPTTPNSRCNGGTYRFRYIRSIDSTSNVTCPDRTSAAVRATVITGSGRIGGQQANKPLRAVQQPVTDLVGTD